MRTMLMEPALDQSALLEAIRVAVSEKIEPKLVDVQGQVVQDTLTAEETQVLEASFKASRPALLTDGKPTVMRTVAWLAHASADSAKPYINENRLAFVQAEFSEAAGKISATSPLVMDWNHSATRGFMSDDPKVIGVWTRAEVAFDQAAGSWGILASGVVFSWLFPDIADAMLAEQSRLGHVRFSMACLSRSIEIAKDDNGPFEIAHNPTFFTLSALDVPPADPNCIGLGEEGSSDPNLENKLRDELKAADIEATKSVRDRLMDLLAASATPQVSDSPQERTMDKELETLTASLATATETVSTLTARVAELEAAAVEAEETHSMRVAELEAARDGAMAELANANTEIERVAGELQTASTRIAEIEAAEAENAKKALVEVRMASLPEAFVTALEAKDETVREKIVGRIAAMTDEDFEFYKNEELGVAGMKVSYVDRSNAEGQLPNGSTVGTTISDRIARHKK